MQLITQESKNKLKKKNTCFKYEKPGYYTKACYQKKPRTELATQKLRTKMLAAARQFKI